MCILWGIFIYTYIHPTSHCSIFRNDSLSRGTFFPDSLTHLNVCNKFNLRKILSWLTLWYLTMLYFCLLCKTLIWKQLSHLTLHICICICNISHLILWYFYPNLHCSFWPQVLNSDMAISILPYIALFTCICKISNLMKVLSHLTFWYLYPYLHCSFCLVNTHMKISIPLNKNSIPPYVVLFLSLLALRFLA